VPALEVRHLQLVDAIAETGTVTAAALRLHVTQSALSHQLREIESRLDVKLFDRLGRRMVLTPAGARVRESARAILQDLVRAEQDIRTLNHDGGTIRLCTQCNTGYHWLPPLLKQFQAKHPAVDVQICVDATPRPLEALLAGEIDLAIMTSPVRDRRVSAIELFRDELVAIVSNEHPWASAAWVRPSAFANEHLFIYSANRADSYTFRYILVPAGVEPARVSEVPLTEAIVELVKAKLGVGVVARWAVSPALEAGELKAVSITKDGVFRTWTALMRRHHATSNHDRPWMRNFITLLAERGLPGRVRQTRGRRRSRRGRAHERISSKA
jgi:LysR family transcriptional regulator, regulator for metE and metH